MKKESNINFQRILKYTSISIVSILILFLLIINLTPIPISLLIRKTFENGIATEPNNYQQYVTSVQKITNLEYPSKFKDNTADLYLPKNSEMYPIIIWIHGGAFVGGDKRDVKEYATMLASNGYAVLAANYERAPELKYPKQLNQIEEIHEYLLTISQKYNIDSNNIILAGDSAGAHLVSQFALIQTSSEYAKKMNFKQTIPEDKLKALLLYSGPFDVEEITKTKSKIMSLMFSQSAWAYFGIRNWESEYGEITTIKNHITPNFPATFITDGNTGSFASHAKDLILELEKNNIKTASYFIDEKVKRGHEYQFKLDTDEGMKSLEETLKFLKSIEKYS